VVYIVDDDASVRDSLSLMLSLHGWRTSSFASAEDFLAVVQPNWQGCVLADIRMPGMSGLQLQRELELKCPRLAVVIVTAHGDVATARQAFLANAVDFLEKPFDAEQVRAALATAASRGKPGTRKEAATARPAVAKGEPLSTPERDVLAWVTRGIHNREIALRLGMSVRAVEMHKARAMDKLGASNLVELVRLGQVSLSEPPAKGS